MALAIASTIRRLLGRIPHRFDSLAARLILAAAVWTMIGLAAGGYVLSDAFVSAVHDSFDTALQVDLDGMIAAAEPELKVEARKLWQEAKELHLIFAAIWRKS